MALKGILWDQGEANDKDTCEQWGCKLAALAKSWRADLFNQTDLIFSFDQMRPGANVAGGAGVANFEKFIPNSVFATRLDLQTCLPNATSSGHAISKLEVGRRLALSMLVKLY